MLLGPGPANVDPRVLQSMSSGLVGHLDPYFIEKMEQIKNLLRYIWQTSNEVILPMSGTGSCAMEASLANLVEPGDTVLIAINGYFGERLAEMASRYGANVIPYKRKWGTAFTFNELETKIREVRPTIFAIVHAETSTGVLQPMEGLGEVCKKNGSLLLVDTVTSLGGVPVYVDKWGIDACYSGSQKCLGAPPGLSPLTFSPRAMEKIKNRKTKIATWYMDITLIHSYWATGTRAYHHTAPISMNWSLFEALSIIQEEGLEKRWNRHITNAKYLWEGLKNLGLELLVDESIRLPVLTTVKIPSHIDGTEVIKYLRNKHHIEISGGLGEYKGKAWRIGLMGYNAQPHNVDKLLGALKDTFQALSPDNQKAKL
uniref:alanine--glyoxylate transaminase n=1 Tax=Arcella intermedia TaxID=1963864 RepID=A0A6B2L705_9EUKA